MKRTIAFPILVVLLILGLCLPAMPTPIASAGLAGYSLRFYGHGSGGIDRVKIRIDAPAVPADVASNFTIEFWMKASLADNPSPDCAPGGSNWLYGNTIIDRDVFGDGDYGEYGLSLANGKIAFGVGRRTTNQTICGTTEVADGKWHHVAVTRQGNGLMRIFVDGVLDASGTGPRGNVSYRNGRAASYPDSDPFLVLGAEKFDTGPAFSGLLDELRISKNIRYKRDFTPPVNAFTADRQTAALYHFDEGPAGPCTGTISDASRTGASVGQCLNGGSDPAGPEYSEDTPIVPIVTDTPTPTPTLPPEPVSDFCPPLPPPSGSTVTVSTEAGLRDQALNAPAGTTILIQSGVYNLTNIIHIVHGGITLRSSTGNREDVILDGGGMLATGRFHVILIEADDVTIADLTIRNGDEHGISVNGADRPTLYNLHIQDTGYQLVKVNPIGDGSDDGVLACSRLEYTTTAPTDYTNGISAHNAHRWVVRDNQWYRIRTPNNVPAPTILFWSGSSDTVVERNRLFDCYQGIAFGNASHGPGDHTGGIVRNNFIYASLPHDSVIEMVHATGWLAAHNTALLLDPDGVTWGMEARFSDTSGTFAYNLTNMPIWNDRDGAQGIATGNITSALPSWFVQPSTGDLHLAPAAASAIDAATPLPQVTADIDGDARPIGTAPDVGADEYDPAASGSNLTALYPIRYAETSPFNQKIPLDPQIDPNSAALVQSLVRDAQNRGVFLVVDKWTVPVYYANADTPRYSVSLTAGWARWFATKMNGAPIPDWAVPDPQDDGSMTIVDLTTSCQYDFWQAKKRDGQWQASWGNSLRIDGDGIFPEGMSARGSGFALLAGMIWPDELKSERIDHALIFSYNYTKRGGPVSPATESDGASAALDAIPEGARVQLDPTLNLDTLNLAPYEKVIAKALQEYGMFLGDNSGGGISFYAVSPASVQGNPYEGILPPPDPTDGFVFLPNIPVDKFRILELGPQNPDPTLGLVPSGCAEMTK